MTKKRQRSRQSSIHQKSRTSKTNSHPRPPGAHDLFFKEFFSDLSLAKELMPLIFSKKQMSACDWKSFKIEKDSFPNKKTADLIFSVSLKGNPKITLKIFILLEHKSWYDKKLYSQLLNYQCFLRAESLKNLGQAMPIIP